MVFKYRRKTDRGSSWDDESMRQAFHAVRVEKKGIRQAAAQFGIPYPTLRKHLIKDKPTQEMGRYRPVFSKEQEAMLVSYIQRVDDVFYGLDRDDLMRLAYEFASQNNIKHPFKNEKAGEQWLHNFRERNPMIALRAPEATCIARTRGFNRPQVELFFKNLESEMEKNKFDMSMIWNVDETGIRTSGTKPPKVFSIRGKKQVGYVKSNEKGTLVTAVCCASASGNYISPVMIFPRQKIKVHFRNGLPPGTECFKSKNGWINSQLFLEWLKFFVRHVRPTPANKALLILDNHESHRNYDVIEYARQNNVVLLSLPPHTSHRVQPLDVSVYSSFKGKFERVCARWQKRFPGHVISLSDIGELFAEAYLYAATPNNAIHGFEKTGIAKCDIDVFQDRDFMPADVTNDNIALEDVEEPTAPVNQQLQIEIPSSNNVENEEFSHSEAEDEPSEISSGSLEGNPTLEVNRTLENNRTPPSTPSKPLLSPEDIRPIPRMVQKVTQKRKSRAQKSEVLTSTPVKERIKANHERKKLLEQKKLEKQAAKKENTAPNVNGSKKMGRKAKIDPKTEKKEKKVKKNEPTLQLKFPKPPTEPVRENDVACIFCCSTESTSRETWYQCNICSGWAHEACSDYNKVGFYVCDFCKTSR